MSRPAPAAVASPCTGVCAIEPQSGWCEGCLRTLDEIAAWGALDDRARREICKRVPARRAASTSHKPSSRPEPSEGIQGQGRDPSLRSG